MSSASQPIPPPNDRRGSRSSRSSSNAGFPEPMNSSDIAASESSGFVVGGPPGSPSPLALRASTSPHRRKSRGARIPPDFHLLDYVNTPDSNLICLICHCPFDRPVRLACEHYFCRICLDHAWDAQPEGCKTCPTCRHKVDADEEPLPVPKILERMLDELLVRCPNSKLGCPWVEQRSNLENHVMLYCEYALVECPASDCRLPVSQKDCHKGCLHYSVSCDNCHTSLLRKDLEDHQRATCQFRFAPCPHCSAELLRLDLNAHINDVCPKATVQCPGSIVGCKYSAERETVAEHETACPMATMAPFFRDQQARIERNEARFEPLVRKVGILEDGLSNITNMLYPANANDSSFPVTNPLDSNNPDAFPPAPLMPTPDFRLPPASFPPAPHNNDQSHSQPPFDSQIHHLLTLHDSLRDELSRVASALSELEGRTSMMIMNENQRVKEEMLHTNAAINGMRVQLHWLMSATLHQRTSASASSSATRAGGSASASGSGRSSASGTPTTGGATMRGPAVGMPPLRRLSDSIRQDTKL
ncbi:uncharacterized protein EI97DRAFT_392397 [Westerdykella ornata]|uniref:TRAF-type zinc finger protein n=1 Tax=Westerdykella ornata TaxID=318751 RepID=A0A6A6JSA6_WESOR|nr:uncharacterized protein EI97DRAFT_392397 [Westerdykella ornata]KAF2279480.1 hypothetical protein EI97DRAFT_392397 [Westerdykella ornata]